MFDPAKVSTNDPGEIVKHVRESLDDALRYGDMMVWQVMTRFIERPGVEHWRVLIASTKTRLPDVTLTLDHILGTEYEILSTKFLGLNLFDVELKIYVDAMLRSDTEAIINGEMVDVAA